KKENMNKNIKVKIGSFSRMWQHIRRAPFQSFAAILVMWLNYFMTSLLIVPVASMRILGFCNNANRAFRSTRRPKCYFSSKYQPPTRTPGHLDSSQKPGIRRPGFGVPSSPVDAGPNSHLSQATHFLSLFPQGEPDPPNSL
ncbi:MAG: hypothetical protein R6U98_10210, partial [Pirellulaceae bacterium]